MAKKVAWGDWKVPLESVDYLARADSLRCLNLLPVVEVELDDSPDSYAIYEGIMTVIADQGGWATDGKDLYRYDSGTSMPHAGNWVFYIGG
jgi:hypothetical protein